MQACLGLAYIDFFPRLGGERTCFLDGILDPLDHRLIDRKGERLFLEVVPEFLQSKVSPFTIESVDGAGVYAQFLQSDLRTAYECPALPTLGVQLNKSPVPPCVPDEKGLRIGSATDCIEACPVTLLIEV